MKRNISVTAIGLSALVSAATMALAADRTVVVRFASGASSATISGKIKGYDGVNYLLDARAGQMMHVLFSPNHNACYFNVYAPGAQAAMHRGEVDGNEFSVRLSDSGDQRVQVYLMRSAARRDESCKFTISFEITGGASENAGAPGDDTSPETMMQHCRNRAHKMLNVRLTDIETKYEGQRVDGTHAVNGTAYHDGKAKTFQCSFGKHGNKIIQFVLNN